MNTIVITGPSGSGKTILSRKLYNLLDNSILIHTDSYYRDDLFIKCLSFFIYDIYDRKISIRDNDIKDTINSLYRNDKLISFYKYNFKKKRSTRCIKRNDFKKTLILEGIFAHRLNINYKQSINIICEGNKKICYTRRLNRDLLERDRKMDEVNKRFNKSWYLYYNNLKNYIRSNKVIYINTIDSNNYEQLIRKLKYLY